MDHDAASLHRHSSRCCRYVPLGPMGRNGWTNDASPSEPGYPATGTCRSGRPFRPSGAARPVGAPEPASIWSAGPAVPWIPAHHQDPDRQLRVCLGGLQLEALAARDERGGPRHGAASLTFSRPHSSCTTRCYPFPRRSSAGLDQQLRVHS